MGNRLSKIYTRTGDGGTTGLGDGSRVDKTAARVMAMGDVDEINCLIGVMLAEDFDDDIKKRLSDIQHGLFDLGGEISIPGYNLVKESYVEALEGFIDEYNEDLPPLRDFILPAGNRVASLCHLARAVCRRAERTLLQLAKEETVNPHGPVYLNRLSDLLFVLARKLNKAGGSSEVYWEKDRLNR